MTPHALEAWLETDDSREVGIKPAEGGESTGHASGRRIVKLLQKRKRDYMNADHKQMHRNVGYIKSHLAQRPDGDISQTRWAYRLKDRGHDPER